MPQTTDALLVQVVDLSLNLSVLLRLYARPHLQEGTGNDTTTFVSAADDDAVFKSFLTAYGLFVGCLLA